MNLFDVRRLGKYAGLCAVLAAAADQGGAQTVSVGADVVSRYVWRGFDFGESMAVQPALTISGSTGFEIGAWGSYSVSSDGSSGNEADLWVGYAASAESGASLSLVVTDYYFPAPSADASYFEADGHTLEGAVAVSGPDAFPLSLLFAQLLDGNGSYLEASVPFSGWGADFGLTAGFVLGDSDFYGTEGIAFTNVGISASTELEISSGFAPPVTVSYIVNPDLERAYLVWGISF